MEPLHTHNTDTHICLDMSVCGPMLCSGGASVATLMGHPATTPKTAPTHACTQRQEVADMGHVQYVLLYLWIVKTHLVNSSQRAAKKKSIPLSPP